MSSIRWPRVVAGIIASFLVGVLILAALIAIVLAFSSAESIQEVQSIPRFGFVTSVLTALAAAWGAFFALRRLPAPARYSLHGLLIGLGAGLLHFIFTPENWVANLFTLLMAIPAAVLGSRIAERNSLPR